jgi:thioredoxin-related protein
MPELKDERGAPVTRTRFFVMAILVAGSLPLTDRSASAQDVKWRYDYSAARKEATETGRPLVLDFGTEACFWCKKLDATTFRDPKVVKLLNERFIPVKIDGNKDQRLTAALKIDGFPTLILATPDGKVIDRHAGYADVAQFTAMLNKAPAPVAPAVPAPGAEKLVLSKAELDAGLAALHAEIAATLDR